MLATFISLHCIQEQEKAFRYALYVSCFIFSYIWYIISWLRKYENHIQKHYLFLGTCRQAYVLNSHLILPLVHNDRRPL
jgi:hypothetical protein